MATCPKCSFQFQIKGRSNPQNNSYWGLIVTPFAEFLGLTTDECHELLKYKFNSEVIYKTRKDGMVEEIRRIKSTTTQTTVQNNEYCSQCRIWASQLGCYLAEPNEMPIKD